MDSDFFVDFVVFVGLMMAVMTFLFTPPFHNSKFSLGRKDCKREKNYFQ